MRIAWYKVFGAMFGSDILEVAIAMAFLYLFMSTIASALREAFEAFLKQRASDLERGLVEMLRTGDDKDWVEKLYNHPLISSLYLGTYDKPDGKLPSYIPKQSFSMAILDLAAEASQTGKVLSLPDLEAKLTAGGAPNAVQRVVLTAFSAAGHDLADVRQHLEDWYDAAMERVTGWYTRRTAVFLFIFGFGAAAVLNVDSLAITKRLIVDRPLRQAIVAQAEKTVEKQAGSDDKPGAETPASKSFDELRSEFAEIGYPIGWTSKGAWPYPAPQACKSIPSPDGGATFDCKDADSHYWGVLLLALMGWLVTAIAIMLGAPFWFDLLNKLVSLRSALKPADDKPAAKKAKPKAAPRKSAQLSSSSRFNHNLRFRCRKTW